MSGDVVQIHVVDTDGLGPASRWLIHGLAQHYSVLFESQVPVDQVETKFGLHFISFEDFRKVLEVGLRDIRLITIVWEAIVAER